jgi:hypothetical protein
MCIYLVFWKEETPPGELNIGFEIAVDQVELSRI